MAEDLAIHCENLVKIYRVADLEVFALQGLELEVRRGELIGLVGPSGSGKSTLLNILGGLDRPSAGRVWVNGIDLLKLHGAGLDAYRRQTVGFVWQQSARNLIPHLDLLENVQLPLALGGRAGPEQRRRAEALLEAVGLAERRHHRLGQLSGGEQQRAAIAVALSNQPALLLADEPTGEVDSTAALAIYQTFRTLNRDYGVTIVIVSHDPGVARHVDRVVAIRDGKTAAETVHRPAAASNGGEASEHDGDGVLEEWALLDSAGRLQIPKDYLERFQIRSRALLELTPDGILVRPAAQTPAETETVPAPEAAAPAHPRGLAGRLAGWWRGRRSDNERRS